MAASSSLPLAAAAAAAAALLLVVSTVVPAAAAGGKQYSGGARMVIIRRGPAGTRAGGAAGTRASSSEWRYGRGRLLEDEVAPELGDHHLLGAGEGRSIGYDALEKERPVCPSSSQCAAKGGGSYTRGCTYQNHCPH